MSAMLQSRSLMMVFGLVVGAAVGACQAFDAAPGPPSPPTAISTPPDPPPADPNPRVIDVGAVTLTDEGCWWDANPGSVPAGRLAIELTNETDDHAVFFVHKLHADRTYAEGIAAVEAIQGALETGDEWPPEVSEAIAEASAGARERSEVTAVTSPGTLGIVCSANTSPTGDILSVFLVGPLEVTAP
jgi:hypothetical protein